MKKPLTSEIADLLREMNNLEQAYRDVDDEWREIDVRYIQLKRKREELEIHKRDLAHEIEWRVNEIAALQEAIKHEPYSA